MTGSPGKERGKNRPPPTERVQERSKGDTLLTNQEILLGKGTWVESSRIRDPRRAALPHGWQLGFYGDGISFWVVFSQSF